MNILWPDHSQLFSMSGNVKVEQFTQLYLTPEDPTKAFWFAIGFNQYWHPYKCNEGDIIHLVGSFPNGTFLEAEHKGGTHGKRIPLNEYVAAISIPVADLLDADAPQDIRMLKFAGTTAATTIIRSITVSNRFIPYIAPRSRIFCVTKPSWGRGIWRNQEKEVCLERGDVYFDHQLQRIEDGDTLYMRPVDQEVTVYEYERLQDLECATTLGKNCKVINPIETLYNYKLKDVTFDIWAKNDLAIPEYEVINSLKELELFCESHDRSVVRLNGSCSGRDTHVISDVDKCESIYDDLITDNQANIELGHIHSRLLATDKIEPTDGYHVTARCYVAHGHIFNTYAYVHRMHNNDSLRGGVANSDNYRLAFVKYNKLVLEWASKYRNDIVRSVKCLGLDVACIEYIVTDDGPVFLECNAFWGSGIRRGTWPHTAHLTKYLEDNITELIDEIPNVYFRMDENKYWSKFYNLI